MLGAVCPQTGQSVGLLAPSLNTDSVNAFFKEFKKETHPGVHVVMSWDQAGFHMSKKVKVPENVTIMPLPAYSPELNPIENLWHYLRAITGLIAVMLITTIFALLRLLLGKNQFSMLI